MRALLLGLLASIAVAVALSCSGGSNSDDEPSHQCNDGVDNDGDGSVDFPDDLGCVADTDDSEDTSTSAKCKDGRDNDGDGRIDYPADPGCFAPNVDDETDDCPSGPTCPQCADGIDNDGNGSTDYPDDSGCEAAADDDEFLHNPAACGGGMMVFPLPTTGEVTGTFGPSSTSMVMSPCGGGAGSPAFAYELHLTTPKVVELSTDDSATTADTIIDLRSEACAAANAEIACNDDFASGESASKLTRSLAAGDYYIIVSGVDSASEGAFKLIVKQYAGEGASCAMPADCGTGLVCRVPLGGSSMVCSKPVCDDGVDDDGDNDGADYPNDPGCTSKTDNDENDDCPSGPNCPECGDGDDNDGDGQADYPNDTTCLAKGDASESCPSTDGVTLLTQPMTMGDTGTANNDITPSCASSSSHSAGDRTYRLDVPALSSLTITTPDTAFSSVLALFDSTCTGASIACAGSSVDRIAQTNVPAGTYFFVVDGYSTGTGTYTVNITGRIQNNASCEYPLAESGALACGVGYACKGTMGMRTCQPAKCSDGISNSDGDTKIDYPEDPGCSSPADDTEDDPVPLPVCANAADEDGDNLKDWPADYGCAAASGTSEVFCTPEVDATALIATSTVTGTTAGLTNNFMSATSCPTSNPGTMGPDKAYALSLPVPVASLVIDTNTSGFDTVVTFRDAQCGTQIACDDDSGDPGTQSKLTLTNVQAGNYAIIVDGYSFSGAMTGASGMYTLTVKGTVDVGTACTSPLFSGGAQAVLKCPTTCNAGVCQ